MNNREENKRITTAKQIKQIKHWWVEVPLSQRIAEVHSIHSYPLNGSKKMSKFSTKPQFRGMKSVTSTWAKNKLAVTATNIIYGVIFTMIYHGETCSHPDWIVHRRFWGFGDPLPESAGQTPRFCVSWWRVSRVSLGRRDRQIVLDQLGLTSIRSASMNWDWITLDKFRLYEI